MGKTAQQAINNMLKEAGKYDIFDPRKINHALPTKVKPEDFNWGKYFQHKLRQGKVPSVAELKYNFPKHLEKKSNLTEELSALDKDLSNLTDAQLNELAKKQQTQLKRMAKPKKPKPPSMPSMSKLNKTAEQFRTLLEKDASKAKSLKGFDETLTKLLGMKKSDPKRPELMKAIEEMAPEALAKNPNATPAFMKVRDAILKTGEAESKSQQRLMGMVHAYQNGELDMSELDQDLQYKIRSMAKTMSKKDTKDYAETKHKGLPEKKASLLSIINKAAPKLTKRLDNAVQNQRQRFTQKAEYAKRTGNPERASRFEYKANKVDKDLQSARQARKPVEKTTEIVKVPEPEIKEVTKIVEKKKPMSKKTKGLLAATGVTGMVGAGAIGYNMGEDER